jgi:hypothetical protein
MFIALTSSVLIYYLTRRASVSAVITAAILIYPNNINNICWMAARVDLICTLFYVITLLLAIIYIRTSQVHYMILAIITFILSLLTKELAITLPITSMLMGYYIFGKEGFKKSLFLLIAFAIIIIIYLTYRFIILGNSAADIATLYQQYPLSNAPGVLARAIIAISIPLDFITLNFQLRNDNKIILLYLFLLYGTLFYLFWNYIRKDLYKIIGQLLLLFFVLIIPYMIVGYIRPQMILLPFVTIGIVILYQYNEQTKTSERFKNSLHLNKGILKASFICASIFCIYWGGVNINDWKTAYDKSLINVNNLIEKKITKQKFIVIGNPGRYKQAFMFDKLTGAYNFWKYNSFTIKDTINDVIQTAAFQEESIGAKFEVNKLNEYEAEIKCTAPKQFFYIEGYTGERIRTGFRNNDIEVEFTEFNVVDKPIKLKLKILNTDTECLIADELGFKYLNEY